MGNSELLEALNILEREKNISKETLLEADRQKKQIVWIRLVK